MAAAEQDGRLVVLPDDIWRVIKNRTCNEYNDEPEYRIQKYHVFAYDADADKFWVDTPGWHGFKQRHWLNNKRIYHTFEAAEAAMNGGDGDGS